MQTATTIQILAYICKFIAMATSGVFVFRNTKCVGAMKLLLVFMSFLVLLPALTLMLIHRTEKRISRNEWLIRVASVVVVGSLSIYAGDLPIINGRLIEFYMTALALVMIDFPSLIEGTHLALSIGNFAIEPTFRFAFAMAALSFAYATLGLTKWRLSGAILFAVGLLTGFFADLISSRYMLLERAYSTTVPDGVEAIIRVQIFDIFVSMTYTILFYFLLFRYRAAKTAIVDSK